MKTIHTIGILLTALIFSACSKKSGNDQQNITPTPVPSNFSTKSWTVNGSAGKTSYYDVPKQPVIVFNFLSSIDRNSTATGIQLKDNAGNKLNYTVGYDHGDSTLTIIPAQPFAYYTKYRLSVSTALQSANGGYLNTPSDISLITSIDSSDKFPQISDDSLLTVVQKQTFKYFWDFAHPVSGLARERNTSGDIVTMGGSGFGIMAIVTGIYRNFITRSEGLARLQQITGFLKNKAQTFHGAFPHWMNGSTGAVVPFSPKDDGADLVETAYLFQGLLTARQFFNGTDSNETSLRDTINFLWNAVEWSWFRKNNEDVLYWHWSPDYQWDMNMPIHGWDEALITYILAASSTTYSIPKSVYDNGWALNGGIRNGKSFYNIQLPLGPDYGGPLFFAHYSFLGVNPNSLSDAYAQYDVQNKAHSLINYNYCKTNPKGYFGYSDSCWGLTASDDINGYLAHEPVNDDGVISPTAALSSFPYTPAESMKALKFFYYRLGDKLFKEYGFVDAFSLKDMWFAGSFLAIDQGPTIIMIENYRSDLLWNLFMSCPEIKTGMHNLGFQSPNL